MLGILLIRLKSHEMVGLMQLIWRGMMILRYGNMLNLLRRHQINTHAFIFTFHIHCRCQIIILTLLIILPIKLVVLSIPQVLEDLLDILVLHVLASIFVLTLLFHLISALFLRGGQKRHTLACFGLQVFLLILLG